MLGWDWRWYKHWRGGGEHSYPSARTPPTKNVWVHTCNHDPGNTGDAYSWGVRKRPSATCGAKAVPYYRDVYPGHRATFYRTGANKKCRYDSWVTSYGFKPLVKHGLGIMKP